MVLIPVLRLSLLFLSARPRVQRALTRDQAANHGHESQGQWHPGHSTGVEDQPDHGHERVEKKKLR